MTQLDDGFFSWLVGAATFDSALQIPNIEAPTTFSIPINLIPFSKRQYSSDKNEFIHFYEHDVVFRKLLQNPEDFIQQFYPFPGMITPDCSIYRDMPLVLQLTNTYMSRAIGCFFQEQGKYVIPNVRWGDERSYHEHCFGEKPFAFIGLPEHSILSISAYGCIRGFKNRQFFYDGLNAMMKWLKPAVVLVHRAMPPDVFKDALPKAEFHQYDNWITQKRKKVV